MRREVMWALAALADAIFQEMVWTRRTEVDGLLGDTFTENVHRLFDDNLAMPDPEKVVGAVLIAGLEVERLRDLGGILARMIHDLGEAPDATYIHDPRWERVVHLAGLALAAMVRAGGFAEA